MKHPWIKHLATWIYGEAGAKHVTIGKLLGDVLFIGFLVVMVVLILGVLWLS